MFAAVVARPPNSGLHQQRPRFVVAAQCPDAQRTACISTSPGDNAGDHVSDSPLSSSWPCALRLCARSRQPGWPSLDSVPTVTKPWYARPASALGLSFDSAMSLSSPENCPTVQVIVKHAAGWRGEHAKLATATLSIHLFQMLFGRHLSRKLTSLVAGPQSVGQPDFSPVTASQMRPLSVSAAKPCNTPHRFAATPYMLCSSLATVSFASSLRPFEATSTANHDSETLHLNAGILAAPVETRRTLEHRHSA
ncbi:hypothetical protein PSPO01_12720 [Paraphaeosphaeria sporulosa]